MAKLGDVIRRLIDQRHLSQGQLAAKSGLSVQTISNIRTGKVAPRGETYRRIAQALDMTTQQIDALVAAGDDTPTIPSNVLTRLYAEANRYDMPLSQWLLLVPRFVDQHRQEFERYLRSIAMFGPAPAGARDRKAAKPDPDQKRRTK